MPRIRKVVNPTPAEAEERPVETPELPAVERPQLATTTNGSDYVAPVAREDTRGASDAVRPATDAVRPVPDAVRPRNGDREEFRPRPTVDRAETRSRNNDEFRPRTTADREDGRPRNNDEFRPRTTVDREDGRPRNNDEFRPRTTVEREDGRSRNGEEFRPRTVVDRDEGRSRNGEEFRPRNGDREEFRPRSTEREDGRPRSDREDGRNEGRSEAPRTDRNDRPQQLSMIDLEAMTLPDLREVARKLDLPSISGLKKQDLIVKLMQAQTEEQGHQLSDGVLDIVSDGFGFLRSDRMLPGADDVYVSQSQIRRFGLRTGDRVMGQIRPPKESERYFSLLRVESTLR